MAFHIFVFGLCFIYCDFDDHTPYDEVFLAQHLYPFANLYGRKDEKHQVEGHLSEDLTEGFTGKFIVGQ